MSPSRARARKPRRQQPRRVHDGDDGGGCGERRLPPARPRLRLRLQSRQPRRRRPLAGSGPADRRRWRPQFPPLSPKRRRRVAERWNPRPMNPGRDHCDADGADDGDDRSRRLPHLQLQSPQHLLQPRSPLCLPRGAFCPHGALCPDAFCRHAQAARREPGRELRQPPHRRLRSRR